jgi:hypothetical protein
MRKIVRILTSFLIAVLISATLPTIGKIANSSPSTVIHVDPSSLIDTGIGPGQTITFKINVTDVIDLYTWQIKILFDPNVLNCTKAYYPPDHIFAGKTTSPVTPVINNNEGYVLYGNSLVGAVPGVTGDGKLCALEFKVKSRGSTSLTFVVTGPGRTFLLDSNGDPIPFTVEGGHFSNKLPPPPAKISVKPSRIVDPLLTPCSNFPVNVTIAEATDVYAFEFKLSYDKNVLTVIQAEIGDFFTGVTPTIQINNTLGYVYFKASLTPPAPPKSGNGTLGKITFHVENLGACTLHLYDTKLTDQSGGQLTYTLEDGFFNNILLAKLYVEPPEIIDPTMVPPKTFDINITIDDVEDLYSFEFKLTYNTQVLTCYGLIVNKDQSGYYPTSKFTVDDRNGYAWINATFNAPANPITTFTPQTLVTVKFQVEALGVSPLNLTETRLSDSEGNPIPHEVQNGIFITLIRDVAVVNVVASENMVYQGWPVEITVTVENKGDIAETFNVTAYYDNNPIGTALITNLAPKNTTTTKITWLTTGVQPCHNYTISAYAWPVPYEMSLADNRYVDGKVKIKMLGDINGDGIIDYIDINAIATAFGATPSNPRWNPNCDLNRDGVIDMSDMYIVAVRFGKRC